MNRRDRNMAQKLESVLAAHEMATRKALADLKTAGFERITSIEDAYRRLDAQREFAGFTQQQIDIAIYAMEKRARNRAAAEEKN